MRTLEIQLPMCGLTWPVLISTIYLSILSILSCRPVAGLPKPRSSLASPDRARGWLSALFG